MGGIEKILQDARANPANVRFADLRRLCEHQFKDADQIHPWI
jgi:hypothetical protein